MRQHDAWLDSTFERRCSWERWIIGGDATMGHDKFGYFKKNYKHLWKNPANMLTYSIISVVLFWNHLALRVCLKSLKQQKHWAGPLWILKLGKVRLRYDTLWGYGPRFNEFRSRETHCPKVCWFTSVLGKWLWMLKAVELDPWQNVFNEALDGHISRGHWHALRRGKAMHFVLYTVFFYVIFPSVCVS